MAKKIIAVVGATGIQGGSVAETFLADSNWQVRAITRNASSSKAQALQAKGAEIAEANLNDAITLEKAFQNASVVFGVTDFWTLYADQSLRETLKPDQSMVMLTYELEMQQGKNIFDAAAKIPTLERLIYSSLPNTRSLSNGKYSHSYHFEAKALAAEYAQQKYAELWSKTSEIQLGFYLTNYYLHPWLVPTKNAETDTYEIKTLVADSPSPMVAAEKDTGVLVKALIAAEPGKKLTAFRERMNMSDYAKLWSQILGVKAKTVVVEGIDQAPAELAEDFADTFDFAREFGFYGEKVDKSLTTPEQLDPALELGNIEQWIKAQDWSHIIKN